MLDLFPKMFQELVGFRKVFAIRAFAFIKVRHRVQPHSVHTHAEPEVHDGHQAAPDVGTLKI